MASELWRCNVVLAEGNECVISLRVEPAVDGPPLPTHSLGFSLLYEPILNGSSSGGELAAAVSPDDAIDRGWIESHASDYVTTVTVEPDPDPTHDDGTEFVVRITTSDEAWVQHMDEVYEAWDSYAC